MVQQFVGSSYARLPWKAPLDTLREYVAKHSVSAED
jgi:hypothetical protein